MIVVTLDGRGDAALSSQKAALFGLLANPVRIGILELLRDGGTRSASLIGERLGLEPGSVDDEVARLRRQGLIESSGDASMAHHRASDPRIFQLLELASEVLTTHPSPPAPGEES